ncbi:MAG: acyl-CoA dehydrogenase, partial [Mycobacterium sp.]|nr:acyl-CoA dehydrogenase [Mycobacterium sp.]
MKGTYTENVDFSITEEDEAFRAELRTWLDEYLPPFLAEWSDGGDPAKDVGAVGFNRSQERRKAWQRLLNEGRWAAINWPKEWNGREATPVQNTIYSEELARVRTPAVYNPNGLWQIGPVIIANGTEEQKQRWLPSILSADVHWCQGFSEPE